MKDKQTQEMFEPVIDDLGASIIGQGKAAEWTYVQKESVRVVIIDQEGCIFYDDVGEGYIWYFRACITQFIQSPEGGDVSSFPCSTTATSQRRKHFFSRIGLLILQRIYALKILVFLKAHLQIYPKRNFGYSRQGHSDLVEGAGPIPLPLNYRMLEQEPNLTNSGTVLITDSSVFPALTTIATAPVEVEAGTMHELHP